MDQASAHVTATEGPAPPGQARSGQDSVAQTLMGTAVMVNGDVGPPHAPQVALTQDEQQGARRDVEQTQRAIAGQGPL